MIRELEPQLKQLSADIEALQNSDRLSDKALVKQYKKTYQSLLRDNFKNITPGDKVYLARHPKRPNAQNYIDHLLTGFIPLCGDRLAGEDESILGGIGLFHGMPITVIAHRKGSTVEDKIRYNFGMPSPPGYRKVQRLAKQAEKFSRPILTLIDTPGAYPGADAERQGQGEAIASCLALFSDIKVPVIAVVIGEGGSGGALALGVANTVIMLENAVYSILSPEGFASILWKDAKRKDEACQVMKLTAQDLKGLGVIDFIVEEGMGSAVFQPQRVMENLDECLQKEFKRLGKQSKSALVKGRYEKFRAMGSQL